MDAVHQIRQFNSGRDPQLLAIKYGRLRANAFSFFRGTCHLFYDRLPKVDIFKNSPLVWACGDLHPENFGSYKGDNRLAYFDINDFDEAALAPAGWDLIRMLTSVLVGTDGLKWAASVKNNLGAIFLDAYAASLATGKPYWVERETATGPVRVLMLAGHCEHKQPLWLSGAHRIVELQQRSQAVPIAFLQPVQVDDAAYVLRELQPSEDQISFTPLTLALPELQERLVSMGKVVAWAHLRGAGRQDAAMVDELIEFGQNKKWQLELLTMSRACAQQVRQDATVFNEAYDQGVFNDR